MASAIPPKRVATKTDNAILAFSLCILEFSVRIGHHTALPADAFEAQPGKPEEELLMTKATPENKPQPSTRPLLRLLPMPLQLGNLLADELSAGRVIGRRTSTR